MTPKLCERCEEDGTFRTATYIEHGWQLCDSCRDEVAEQQYEAFVEDYHGGSGPVTLQEQYDAAAKQKREQR